MEVSGFGTRAVHVQRKEDGSWAASFRLPPAFEPGWHPVRLRFADTGFSNELRIAVDVPAGRPTQLAVKDLSDGNSWNRGEVSIADGGFMSFWVSGLPENRSALDLRVLLGEIPLQITWIGPTETSGYCQINAKVPPDLAKGSHDFQIQFAGASSEPQVGEGSISVASKPAIEARRRIDFSKELAAKGWYHSFELPDGTFIDGFMTVEQQKRRYAQFPIPDDLSGKRLLDIGAWDGWFSFEAARHGADVTAIDCVEQPTFLDIQARLGSKVDYRIMDFLELPAAGLGTFDIVFFLGVLYHVRHPLLALEMVCALTRDVAIVDSFVTDPDDWQEHTGEIPTMEFYELDELGNQFGNWVGPTVECLLAMCRAAGFARVEFLGTGDHHAVVACYRKWEPAPAEPAGDPPEVLTIENARSNGINFSTRKSEEYLTSVFRTTRDTVTPEMLRLEVDDFGAAALFVSRDGDTWRATFHLPPGLDPGWHTARLRFSDSGFGREFRIAVDVPPVAETAPTERSIRRRHLDQGRGEGRRARIPELLGGRAAGKCGSGERARVSGESAAGSGLRGRVEPRWIPAGERNRAGECDPGRTRVPRGVRGCE